MVQTMNGPAELWRMRKQFALQLASLNFLSFVFCLTGRGPQRYHLSRSTGQMTMSELLPSMSRPDELRSTC
jgi:transformation/transcription domain-associated protein